jgi:AraC-like DNA-binding protein
MVQEFRPGPALRPWVAACWSTNAVAEPIRVLPDGCADIIIDRDRDEAFVVGTMTRPLFVEPDRAGNFFGIRFHPGRLAAILGVPLREVTDARVPLRDVSRHLEVHVESMERDLARLTALETDPRVDAAIDRIIRSGGRCDIARVASLVNVTRQHLARLFAENVGISPKLFARVIRFRYAMRLGREKPWADVAAELGYADQSHLIAEFREFSGMTPVPFFLSPPDGIA